MRPHEDEQARPEVVAAVNVYVVALGRDVRSPNGRAALATLGEDPVVTEFVTGAPAVHERHLSYPSGAEVLLRDGLIAGFWFHTEPSLVSPGGFDPTRLLPGLPAELDWDAVKAVVGPARRFGFAVDRGSATDGFAVRDATLYVTLRRVDGGERLVVERLFVRPAEIDRRLASLASRCRACVDVAVCDDAGAMDVDATLGELAARLGDGRLTEDPYRVRLRDVRDLRASGLMERIEVHLDCAACRTTWCLLLPRDGEPTLTDVAGFGHQHPKPAVPPLELWAGADRWAEAAAAMKVIDWVEGGWFLMEKPGELYLDVNVAAGLTDISVLVRLTEGERAAYERGGHAFVDDLAGRINSSGAYRDTSPWFARNLHRSGDRAASDEASSAIGAWQQQVRWGAGEAQR